MSITRRDYGSPRLTAIRMREEAADRRKVASIVMVFVAIGLFCTVAAMIWAPVLR